MGDYAVMITTALVTAISPQIQKAYRSNDYMRYRKLYFLCQGVCLLTSIMICVWIPEIYDFLIRNESLKQSSAIASYMCFSNVVFAFYVFMSTPVFIEKNTMQLLWLVFVPGVLNLILCFVFIPIYGYKAAIYTTIFSYWTQLLIPFLIGYYKRNVRQWLGSLSKIYLILFFLIVSLLLAQLSSEMDIHFRFLESFFLLAFFFYFYKKKHIYELI
jgi:O-antigen/teichoic acid export membrane protein